MKPVCACIGYTHKVLANVEPLVLSGQACHPVSSGCALLWLDPTSSAASLILEGKVQVSLSEKHGATAGNSDVGPKLWIPAKVFALPILSSPGGQKIRQQELLSPPVTPSFPALHVNADEAGNISECCSAFVSPCLAEALGITTARHASREGGKSNRPFELLIRALSDSEVVPAAIVDLKGPYPITTGSTPTPSQGSLVPTSSPPAPLVAAVESILHATLEGELLSKGSVVGVAGFFGFVVTGLKSDQREGEQQRSLSSGGGKAGFTVLVARVHGATELRLSPPTRAGDLGFGIDERTSAIPAAPDASASGCGGARCGRTTSIQGNAKEFARKSASDKPCEVGVGFHGRSLTPKPASTIAAPDPGVSPLISSYLSPSTANWIWSVEQDVGGLRYQVEAVVAAVARSLRRHEGAAFTAPASGLLLHGPTGAGKTLLARSVAKHSGAPWFFLDCASVFRRDRGDAERDMQEFLVKVAAQSPAVVVLDQVECVSKRRPDCAGITELQVYSVLLEMMDRFRQATPGPAVFFLATCPSSTVLDPSLLQRGRLEIVVRLGALDSAARACALGVHARSMRLHVLHELVGSGATCSSSSLKMSSNEAFRFEGGGEASKTKTGGSPASLHPQHAVVTDGLNAGVKEERGMPRTRGEFFRLVAARCQGYLGSDLERLCREAAMRHMTVALEASNRLQALNRARGQDAEKNNDAHANDSEVVGDGVRLQDFWAALDTVRPASLVGNSLGSSWEGDGGPEVSASAQLVGCEAAMAELRTFILAPLINPSFLRNLGLRPATGALLHGPPGCGKTSVARALAMEIKGVANFVEVRCSDLVNKVVGRSERAVSDLFVAARAAAPCILFLDQVEGIAARRGYHSSTEQTFDRILSTLLVEMDGVMSESGGHVVVLAATNEITRLDPAILRPGRIDRRVYLGPPDLAARRAILRQRLAAMPLKMENSDGSIGGGIGIARASERELQPPRQGVPARDTSSTEAFVEWLAGKTVGASCAQVTGACREASLAALREGIGATEVAPRHFEAALGVQLQQQRQQQQAAVAAEGTPRLHCR